MQIKKCPSCAQYLHFDAEQAGKSCWNCGTFTDFSRRENARRKPVARYDAFVTSRLTRPGGFSCAPRIGRYALLFALPLAAFMLLICNAFDVRIVEDVRNSFLVH